MDDAVECYTRAANMFKMAKNWSQAGKSFCEAANLHSKGGSRHDAATNYVDASNCYKKTDPNEAVNCLLKAIEIYTDMGRFTMAAKHHQSIAEMYENEANDLVSMNEYSRISQLYHQIERNLMSNIVFCKCSNAPSSTTNRRPTTSRAKSQPVRLTNVC